MRWTVLIPVKSLPEAKSRLLGDVADPASHARLVSAIRADTVAAARSAEGVARIVLVADRPGAADGAGMGDGTGDGMGDGAADYVFVQTAPGLNPALREAAVHAAHTWPADGVAALVGDLPALRPAELAKALTLAARAPRSFVPDAPAEGTTLLTVLPGTDLDPAFGVDSAARHASTAARLDAGPGLRHDVDTADDLRAAAAHGLGPATAAALGGGWNSHATSGPARVHVDPA